MKQSTKFFQPKRRKQRNTWFSQTNIKNKTKTMKTTLKSALITLCFGIIATLAFTSCESRKGNNPNGTHNMTPGSRVLTPMSNKDMP